MEPPGGILMSRDAKADDGMLLPHDPMRKLRRPGDGKEAEPISSQLLSVRFSQSHLRSNSRKGSVFQGSSQDDLRLATSAGHTSASALVSGKSSKGSSLMLLQTNRSACSSGNTQNDLVPECPAYDQLGLVDQYETRIKFLESHNQQLIEEKMKLSQQLGIQTQVNNELKKLLVASIGDDLEIKYERLVLDKTQADLELSHLHTVVQDDREQVEQALIQADVWRSKFLASRVMSEELSRWKFALQYKYKESHVALQSLLEEHCKIRALVNATKRSLVRIAEQLRCKDPSLDVNEGAMTTVDIAFVNQDLAEALMQVIDAKMSEGDLLLGMSTGKDTTANRDASKSVGKERVNFDKQKSNVYVEAHELSPAEELAQEVVLNCGIQTEELARMRNDYLAHNRISHFLSTNYHVTFNCCEECRGRTLHHL